VGRARPRPRGWYCPECGDIQGIPGGVVTCRKCGNLGLRAFDGHWPVRTACTAPVADCKWLGWTDGVNDDLVTHLRREHGIAQPCEFCKGTGRKKLRRKAGVTWADCRCCKGAGRYAQIGHAPASGAR
jgi:hypothetical protein